MKKFCITFSLILIIILLILIGGNNGIKNEEYLRIHIRANSNSEVDQNIKYEIKNRVVEYLTPFIVECKSLDDAMKMLNTKKVAINRLVEDYLKASGFDYGSNTRVCEEVFPTRVYDGITLNSGVYDALIIELGSASGDNWWCVVYPPLCFSDSKNVKYRSIINDIIKKYKENKGNAKSLNLKESLL